MDFLSDRSMMYWEGIGGILLGAYALLMYLAQVQGSTVRAVTLFIIALALMIHSEILEAGL